MDDADSSAENIKRFVNTLLNNTVNLVRLGDDMSPCGLCSGVLIPRNGRVFVLSAYHSLKKGRYVLETNAVLEGAGQTIAIPLNSVFHTNRVILKPGTFQIESEQEIDFGWCQLDIDRACKEFAANPELRGRKIELPYYQGPLSDRPMKGESYGYAAWNRGQIIDGYARFLERSASYELDMKFDGLDSESGLYRFALARDHQGHRYYKGASGAPIADPTGKIVSLLIEGREGDDFLWGLPLADYVAFVGIE